MEKAKVAGALGVCDSVTLSLHIQTNRFRFVGLEGEGVEGDSDASESNGFSRNSSENRYSSITCSGGTQRIPWEMQGLYADRPQPRSKEKSAASPPPLPAGSVYANFTTFAGLEES